MKKAAPALAVAALLAGCGGGSTTYTFQAVNPLLPNTYIVLTGPSGLMSALKQDFLTTKIAGGGFILGSHASGHLVCDYKTTYQNTSTAALSKYVGQKVRIQVYSDSALAPSICKGMESSVG